MKAQFFIISSVIIIYVIVLIFQYLTGFNDIRTTIIEEEQSVSYIYKIKDSFNQVFIISNHTNDQDLNRIARDFSFTDNFFKQELSKKGIKFDSNFMIFSENFEGGDISRWDHTSIINGATISVLPNSPFGDNYVNFTTFGLGSGYQADALGIDRSLSEVYAAGYFQVVKGLPLSDDGDRFLFIYFGSSNPESAIALAGVIHTSDGFDHWAFGVLNGSCSGSSWNSFINTSTSVLPNRWYFVELYWKKDNINGTARMWVDNQLVGEIKNQNTSDCGDVYNLRMGINNASNIQQKLEVQGDCMSFGSKMIEEKCYSPKEKYFVFSLKSSQLSTETEFSPEGTLQEILIPFSTSAQVLWLNFNETRGAIAHDLSGYGNDGTYYGETFNDGTLGNGACPSDATCPARTSNGWFGNALNFDGTGDYVSVPFTGNLNVTDEMTISAWIKPNLNQSTGGSNQIIQRLNWNEYTGFFLREGYNQSHYLQFFVGNGTQWTNAPGSTLTADNWYYVTGTVKANDKIRLYVNGTQIGSGTNYVGIINQSMITDTIRIGYEGSTKCFNGTIDEVRIWNRTLTEAEINAEMQNSLSVIRPVVSYSFEESDSANYVNDTHIWVKGKYGSALSFDGVNDYVNDSHIPQLDNNASFTISFWMNQSSSNPCEISIVKETIGEPGTGNLFSVGTSGSSNAEFLPNRVMFEIWNGPGGQNNYFGNIVLQNNVWYYLSYVFDANNSNLIMYINGTLESQISYNKGTPVATQYLTIGRGFGSCQGYFNGILDEVRIWNRTLSQAEIQDVMNRG